MKRRIIFVLVAIFLLSTLTGVVWAAPGVVVDGHSVSYAVDPQIRNDRLVVPLYAFAHELGYSVERNTNDNSLVFMPLFDKKKSNVVTNIPVTTISGTVMAPVRMVAEAVGASVVWNPVFDVATVSSSQDIQAVADAMNAGAPDLWFYPNPVAYSGLPGQTVQVPLLLFNSGCSTETTVMAQWQGVEGGTPVFEQTKVTVPKKSSVQLNMSVVIPEFDKPYTLLVSANPEGDNPSNEVNRNNNNITIVVKPVDNRKKVALTFDDGPDGTYTGQVLDILKKYKVKATFFMLGINTQAFPEVAKRVAAEGNEVGNHSYNHPDFSKLSADAAYTNEIKKTEDIFKKLGISSTVFRPPYGAITSSEKSYFEDKGYAVVLWDVDTRDWDATVNTVDHIVNVAVGDTRDKSIILMHTGGGNRAHTVAALPQIIEKLKAKGYRFCTVTEILDAGGE